MIVSKHTTVITIETLSPDSVPALLIEVAENISNETIMGELSKADGDTIRWTMDIEKQKKV